MSPGELSIAGRFWNIFCGTAIWNYPLNYVSKMRSISAVSTPEHLREIIVFFWPIFHSSNFFTDRDTHSCLLDANLADCLCICFTGMWTRWYPLSISRYLS